MELQRHVVIVVRQDEAVSYRKHNPFANVLAMDKGVNGLSATRQWILEHAKERFHVQLDDDITGFCFKPRSKVYGGVRRIYKETPIIEAVRTMRSWIEEGLAHVGMSERFMAARPSPRPYYENGRTGQFMMYDLRVLRKLNVRFDRVRLMQDLDMNLQLLRAGYPNRVLTKISYVAKPEDYAGGVASYRDDKLKEQMCKKLARLHKGIVTYKTKRKFGRRYHYLRTSWRRALTKMPWEN
jgi:hypothetical protein